MHYLQYVYSSTASLSRCDFYPREAVLAGYLLSSHVYLFVRLSVSSRYCVKTVKRRILKTTPHYSPGTLVYGVKGL